TAAEEDLAPEGSVLAQEAVIHARFENTAGPGTKTSISMNEAGDCAEVLWTAGDAIKVYGALSDGSNYSRTFTTEVGGVTKTDFKCSDWNPSDEVAGYYSIYPAASFQGFNINVGLGVIIPGTQTAVPNGIAEGLNVSYASAASMAEDFTFRNVPSLIKFKLSGDVVGDLESIKFVSKTTVAGEIILADLDADEPTYNYGRYFGDLDEPHSSSVTLNKPSGGAFEAGVDYYIAVYPGITKGFNMIFVNSEGEYIVKTSSKTLEMQRSMIADFGKISLGNAFGDPKVTQYMSKTGSTRPVDMVVLPDGFTADQREMFETNAASAIDLLFDTEPYKTYKDYFNVYFIWEASKQTGGSVTDGKGNITEYHDTAFGSKWGDGYEDMQADASKVYSFVSAHCPDIVRGDLTIDEVPIVIIVNDERYGGRAHSNAAGRSYCVVPMTYGGGSITVGYPTTLPTTDQPVSGNYNSYKRSRTDEDIAEVGRYTGNWKNTLLHEFGGHSFGRLADEYWYDKWEPNQDDIRYHTWPVPYSLNVAGRYDSIPWQELLDRKENLVAVNALYDRIGVYQGGDVSMFNRWRSEKISCMIDNRQYFSTWQRVLIARRISTLAGVTFDLDTFLANDDPTDRVRDGAKRSSGGGARGGDGGVNASGPLAYLPPLPPPELIDDSPKALPAE
ncbi:MAG: hypothetical protein IKX03_00970, partial [Bacteroidales bacterium]|nr:hypothetical protein [Bacteroidales bacterium]